MLAARFLWIGIHQEITVEVATHLLGRCHRTVYVKVRSLREVPGHHTHLDITGNAQVALNALLGSSGLLQLVVGRQQFLMGLLQLVVRFLQTLGGSQSEYHEDGQCQRDEYDDDDNGTELRALSFTLQFTHLEQRVHLVQLTLGIGTADRVFQQVHLTIETCSLLET